MCLRVNWKRGEKVTLADKADITPQYLSNLLCGRNRALPEVAKDIEEKAKSMGIHLSAADVMYPHDSSNPLMNTPKMRKARGEG